MQVEENTYSLPGTDPVEDVTRIELVAVPTGNSPVVISELELVCCYEGKELFENFEIVS